MLWERCVTVEFFKCYVSAFLCLSKEIPFDRQHPFQRQVSQTWENKTICMDIYSMCFYILGELTLWVVWPGNAKVVMHSRVISIRNTMITGISHHEKVADYYSKGRKSWLAIHTFQTGGKLVSSVVYPTLEQHILQFALCNSSVKWLWVGFADLFDTNEQIINITLQ